MTFGEQLDYIGPTSVPGAQEDIPTNSQIQDEMDIGTIKRIQKMIENRQQYYQAVDSLALGDISIENQLIINKKVIFHLQELLAEINKTVNEVEERTR